MISIMGGTTHRIQVHNPAVFTFSGASGTIPASTFPSPFDGAIDVSGCAADFPTVGVDQNGNEYFMYGDLNGVTWFVVWAVAAGVAGQGWSVTLTDPRGNAEAGLQGGDPCVVFAQNGGESDSHPSYLPYGSQVDGFGDATGLGLTPPTASPG